MGGFGVSRVGEWKVPLPLLGAGVLSRAEVFCRDIGPRVKPGMPVAQVCSVIDEHLDRVSTYLSSKNKPLLAPEREAIRELCLCHFLPEGPLKYFLYDPDIEEVCCNGLGPDHPVFVFSKSQGDFVRTNLYFDDFEALRALLNNLTALYAGRRMDLKHPYVMALVELCGQKFRFTAVQERATSTSRIQFSIRKYAHRIYTPADLVGFGTLDAKAVALLWMVFQVGGRINTLIIGRPASGKTTFLQALSLFIPEGQRIIDAEYQPELSFFQGNVAGLMSRPEEGLTMARLIEVCERYRPDRLVIGEVVSKEEVLALLDASGRATGDGIYATYHSNSAKSALQTLYLNARDKASPSDLSNIGLIATLWPVRRLDESGREVFGRRLVELSQVLPELEGQLPGLRPLAVLKGGSYEWSSRGPVFDKLVDYFGSIERVEQEWGLRQRVMERLCVQKFDARSFYQFVQRFARDPGFRQEASQCLTAAK